MKQCAIIYNPNSGNKSNKNFIETYEKLLTEAGYQTTIYKTEYHHHAIEIMLELEYVDLVISIGGDGTFNEVMQGNLKREQPLLLTHIPVGTTNDIGTMFGYGKDMIQNLRLALKGSVKGIDICTINQIPFVYVAGFGKFMNVPYETSRDKKKKFGHFAYLVEGIKNFINPTPLYHLTYQIGNEIHSGNYSFMLISNATRIAGFNNFHKDVKLDDDQFEVLFCTITSKLDIIRSLFHLTKGEIRKTIGFEFHRTNYLKIDFDNIPKPGWCIDGEKLDSDNLSYEISIIKDVKILLPQKNIDKLFTKGKD